MEQNIGNTSNRDQIEIEESIFLEKWIANGFNGARAYAEIHKDVTYESACVCASRLLRKVKISNILEIRNLGLDKFLSQLETGLSAVQPDKSGNPVPDHKTRFPYWIALGKMLGVFEASQNEQNRNNKSVFDDLREKYTIKH